MEMFMIDVSTIESISDSLNGTCNSLDAELESRGLSIDTVPSQILAEIDSRIRLCECCGWWCETHELNEDDFCQDCVE